MGALTDVSSSLDVVEWCEPEESDSVVAMQPASDPEPLDERMKVSQCEEPLGEEFCVDDALGCDSVLQHHTAT